MRKRVLGLDLGPNSIGWALIEEDASEPLSGELIDIGVRVFPEGVDAFDSGKEASRNEKRRIARGMRRQTQRRVRRRKLLTEGLIQAGLWPSEEQEQTALYKLNPYELRAKALTEKLSPHEIGRVFLHLSQRRGFLSNRKRDRSDKEASEMLSEISDNEKERIDSGHETIGAWLADKNANIDHCNRKENDHVRSRHLARRQYEDEFEKLWDAQSQHHPKMLTDELKYGSEGKTKYPHKPRRQPKGVSLLEAFGLHGLIFFQRPMYWPKSVVGLCELEPKQKRCQLSDRRYQRFRLLQEVNNLRYADPDDRTEKPLTDGQRELLLEKLSRKKELTFDQIRKALGFLESVKFNLERGERSKLKGLPIDALIAAKKILGPKWHDRPETEKDEIISALLNNEDEGDAFIERAVSEWGMSATEAEAALTVDLPAGYGRLSLAALNKLLPYLEKGMVYMADDETNSAMHAAGYLRRDQLKRRIFDLLPDPKRTANSPIGDIPNPVVKRTLTEVRKVVNAILREYGKPDAVHIEMTRQVRQGKKARDEYSKRNRQREKERDIAADKLREHSIRVNRENIIRYLIWEEQRHECIYSGKVISISQLFEEGGGVEVDHILPYSRTLDNSQMNKVLCFRTENSGPDGKGNRTPNEWLAEANPDKYDSICQRAGKLLHSGRIPYAKYRRFLLKDLKLDDFIARQLSDTSYITKATLEYLKCLFDKDHDVLGLKGQLTAELRWHWGLDTVLAEIPDSPGWQDTKAEKMTAGEKNRADHRHHAIDALIIALTNRSRLRQLSQIVKTGGAKVHGEILEDPWTDFRDMVLSSAKQINVSHRTDAKVRGALHEETLYGATSETDQWVVRKSVADLSASEVERIRDETIRGLVMGQLKIKGIEFGRGKKPSAKEMKEALAGLTMPSGVPINKVRILKPDKTIRAIRPDKPGRAFVKPGSTHHLVIFEYGEKEKSKREAVFVTMLEAINRIKRKEAVIQRQHPDRPDARFVMSLSSGEQILANHNGEQKILTFKTAASTQGQIYFSEHTDARKSSQYKPYVVNANTLDGKKVTVDLLGNLRSVDVSLSERPDIDEIDPKVLEIAEKAIKQEKTNTWARKQLKMSNSKHLGAHLSAALLHLRQSS